MGPFQAIFRHLATVPGMDWLFMIGLLGIGVAQVWLAPDRRGPRLAALTMESQHQPPVKRAAGAWLYREPGPRTGAGLAR